MRLISRQIRKFGVQPVLRIMGYHRLRAHLDRTGRDTGSDLLRLHRDRKDPPTGVKN